MTAVSVAVVLIAVAVVVVLTSFQDGRQRRDFGVRILNCSLSTNSRFLASGFFKISLLVKVGELSQYSSCVFSGHS